MSSYYVDSGMADAHASWLRQRQREMKEARMRADAAAMAGVRTDASQARADAIAAMAGQSAGASEQIVVTPKGAAVVRVAPGESRRADGAMTPSYREDVTQPKKLSPIDAETERLRVRADAARDIAMETLAMGAPA